MIWSSYVNCVQMGRPTPPLGARVRVDRPSDGALFHIWKVATSHPPYGEQRDLHVPEHADEREVGRNWIRWKTQMMCFKDLQSLEGRENVDLGSHLGHVDLE